MPGGFFRGLAKVAIDSYVEAKAQARAQQQAGKSTANNGFPGSPQQGTFPGQSASYYSNESTGPAVASPSQWNYQQDPHRPTVQNILNQPQIFIQHSSPPPLGQTEWSRQEQTSCHPPPAINAPAKTETKTSIATVTEIASPAPVPSKCSGIQEVIKQGYCTASVPDMDVCSFCYQKYISTSCFAFSFKKIDYPLGSQHCCDIAVKVVRDAWTNACVRAGPSPSAHERGVWLQQFAQCVERLMAQFQVLIDEISPLVQEIQILQLQQQYQQKSAMMQISYGMSSQAIASSNLSSPVWTNAGSISQHVGQTRFVEAGQMSIDIAKKQMRLRQIIAQLNDLYGAEVFR